MIGWGGYLLGCLTIGALVVPPAWAATRLRSRLCPLLSGPSARLAEAIIAMAWLIAEAELLGTLHQFRALPLCLASTASALAVLGITARTRGGSAPQRPREARGLLRFPGTPSFEAFAAIAAVAVVTFEQLSPTLVALRGGVSNFDSLTYHLTTPARWVQDGSLTTVHQIYPGSLFAYYPSNSELLHGLGMLAFSNDVLSPILNWGFLILALLAAWCVGNLRGRGPLAILSFTALVSTPLAFSGGTAVNDLPASALTLAAVALVADSGLRRGELFVAAIAGGLAAGTKATTLPVVLLLMAGSVLASSSRAGRVRLAGLLGLGLAIGGGYWYLRDLVWVGTPVPGLHLGPLPSPSTGGVTATLASALSNGVEGPSAIPSGLRAVFGPTWPVMIALMAVGLLAGLARGRAYWERSAALGAIASVLLWPFAPFTEIVEFAVRYLCPAFAVAGVLLVATPWLERARRRTAMAWLLLLLTFAGLLSLHPLSLPYRGAALAGTLSALLAVGIAMWIRPRGNAARASACLALVLTIIGGKHIADRYLADRYRLGHFPHPNEPMANALANTYDWARGLRHVRIALDGGELQYPLYGPDLSNYVQYLGHTDSSGGFERISSCRAWRRAINVGRFGYVMTVPFGSESNSPPEPSPQAAWTASDPAAQVVLRPGASITIFAIRTPMHPSSCPT